MSYDEFKDLCAGEWKNEAYNYRYIDRFRTKSGGKVVFENRMKKKTALDCKTETGSV